MTAATGSSQWHAEQPLSLEWSPFRIEAVLPFNPVAPGAPPLVTDAQLWAGAAPVPAVSPRFVSPVVFRNKGQALPPTDPWRIIQSYLRRWEAFADVPIAGVDEESVRAATTPRIEEALAARPLDLGMGRQAGYFGAVRLELGGSEKFRRGVCALASYAAYCGTGAKTAFGLGQSERLR